MAVSVKTKWCKGCGLCAEFCPWKVLQMEKEKAYVAAPERCTDCGLCEKMCPDYAIYLVKNRIAKSSLS